MTEVESRDLCKPVHEWRFFVGLFLGVVVGVPITVFCLNYLVDQITSVVVALIIALVVLASIFATLFVFRERFLSAIFRGAKGSVDYLVTATTNSIGQFKDGNHEEATNSAQVAMREFASIYVWGRIRWRMITWILGLVAAIAIYIQGMLLFRQNELFTTQNQIVKEQGDFLRRQNELVSLQNQITQTQSTLQESQYRTEQLAIRSEIVGRTFSLLRDIELEIKEIVDRELAILDREKENEANRPLNLGEEAEDGQVDLDEIPDLANMFPVAPIADQNLAGGPDITEYGTISGHWNDVFADIENWSEYSKKFRELTIDERQRISDVRRDVHNQNVARFRAKSIGLVRESSPKVLLGFEKEIEQSTQNVAVPPDWNPLENDRTDYPRFRLRSSKYRLIAALLDGMNSSSIHEQDILRKAKGEFLLSLVRTEIDLSPIQHDGADLSKCTFSDRTLKDIHFESFNLREAIFENVTFIDTIFDSCNLQQCNFKNCNFRGCKFRYCYLPAIDRFESCTTSSLGVFATCFVAQQTWLSGVTNERIQIAVDPQNPTDDLNKKYEIEELKMRVSGAQYEQSAAGGVTKISGPAYYRSPYRIRGVDTRLSKRLTSKFSDVSILTFYLDGKNPELVNEINLQWREYCDLSEKSEAIEFERPTFIKLDFVGKVYSDGKGLTRFLNNMGRNCHSLHIFDIAPSESFSIEHLRSARDAMSNKSCKVVFSIPSDLIVRRTPNE